MAVLFQVLVHLTDFVQTLFYGVWCLKLLKQADAFWMSNKQKYKYEERYYKSWWALGDIFI